MKSAQVAWTSGVLGNLLGRTITTAPCPILVLFPKEGAAKEYMDEKFMPMVEATPVLREKIDIRVRAQGQRQLFKKIAGGFLKLVGSNSPASVKSSPVPLVCVEEPDDCNLNLRGQGDSIKLAKERTKTFANERIPAAEISHLYLHDRPEQRRGFPWTTSALISLHNLGGYQEAAIIAARVGASKMGFFQQKEDIDSFQNPIDGQAVDNGHGGQDIIDYADPGTFHSLPNGYEFVPFNPDYPHANYDSFVKTCLRSVSGGLGVSYHNLANDLEGVNFSSIRSGVLEERDQWMALQNWYIDSFLCDVFERWLACALLAGAITSPTGKPLPAAKLDKFKRYRWQGRRWAWVDPLKDIQSQEAAIALRVKSRRAVCDELGVDFDETLQQIQQETDLLRQMGLSETPPTQPAANDEDKGDEQNNRD